MYDICKMWDCDDSMDDICKRIDCGVYMGYKYKLRYNGLSMDDILDTVMNTKMIYINLDTVKNIKIIYVNWLGYCNKSVNKRYGKLRYGDESEKSKCKLTYSNKSVYLNRYT